MSGLYRAQVLLRPCADADVIAAVEASGNKAAFCREALRAYVRQRPIVDEINERLARIEDSVRNGPVQIGEQADDSGLAQTLGGLPGL